MTTSAVDNNSIINPIWKDRIERAFKHICRTIDLRQRRDAIPLFATIGKQIQQVQGLRRPRLISEPIYSTEKQSTLYTNCSYNEITGEKLISSLTILPQIDSLPHMFTYVPLQRNFLCDTVTNISDVILEENDEDIKNLLNSDQLQIKEIRSSSSLLSSKRTRRSSKTAIIHDKNNEIILDEEHLLELLKRLQSFQMTSDDQMNLFETLIKLYPSSADLIRDRFGTIFENKDHQSKEFTPNIDNISLTFDTTIENTLHSYFMLFCRRCHRYDCFLHKDKQAIPDLNIQMKNSNITYRPCSYHCYRNNHNNNTKRTKIELKRSHSELSDHILNGYHTKRSKINFIKTEPISSMNGFLYKPLSLKRKLINDLSDWTASDKSLFRIFYRIYGDNLCMIADLLDKTCSQVYLFYKNEYENNSSLQRQSSIASISTFESFSGDSNEILKATSTNGDDDNDTIISNEKDRSIRRSHSSSYRRQRNQQNILLNHQNNSILEKKRHTYYPCDHHYLTPCNKHCYCIRSGNFCEKYCSCSSTKCDNRFPGCRCRSSCRTKQCPCYAAGRECDPDLCTSCGADDFRNLNNELITNTICSCHNVAIQRSLHKPLLLAESDVAGWGMFTQVNIQRNEFIAEYCGEILTQDEGELRGRMYDTIGTSFLFDLNEEYMVDATRRGNKIRFANHSINPNCYAKVILVNGDHRIGIYSKRFITAGEELFFDYRYGANHHLRFVGVEKNTNGDQIDI